MCSEDREILENGASQLVETFFNTRTTDDDDQKKKGRKKERKYRRINRTRVTKCTLRLWKTLAVQYFFVPYWSSSSTVAWVCRGVRKYAKVGSNVCAGPCNLLDARAPPCDSVEWWGSDSVARCGGGGLTGHSLCLSLALAVHSWFFSSLLLPPDRVDARVVEVRACVRSLIIDS